MNQVVNNQRKNKKVKRSKPDLSATPSYSEKGMIDRAKGFAETLCEVEGMELVHVEYHREPSGRILRIYIDKSEGITLADCVNISRQLNDILDVYFENGISYRLEVSSPGPDRPLRKADDFDRFKGEVARIRTKQSFDGQKNFKGALQGISDGNVQLLVGNKTVVIPFISIGRARLVNYRGENKCL